MLSRALKRYYGPLRLPIQPGVFSSPYTHQLMSSSIAVSGLRHWTAYLPLHAAPATPGECTGRFRSLKPVPIGLPHLTRGSASPLCSNEATYRFACATACSFAVGNLRPLIAQTPLPRATAVHGQILGRDLNPQDTQLLPHTVRLYLMTCDTSVSRSVPTHTSCRNAA